MTNSKFIGGVSSSIGVVGVMAVLMSCLLTHSVVQSHVVDWSQVPASERPNGVEQPNLQKQLEDFENSGNTNTTNGNRLQVSGTLELFVHEFDDGETPPVEYCVMIPHDGSDPIVIELMDAYAECREGLSGVFNVTPQENLFFNKQGCDPSVLSSCVEDAAVMMMEAEIQDVFVEKEAAGEKQEDEIVSSTLEDAAAATNTAGSVCYYFSELCVRCQQFPHELCNDFSDLCTMCKLPLQH